MTKTQAALPFDKTWRRYLAGLPAITEIRWRQGRFVVSVDDGTTFETRKITHIGLNDRLEFHGTIYRSEVTEENWQEIKEDAEAYDERMLRRTRDEAP